MSTFDNHIDLVQKYLGGTAKKQDLLHLLTWLKEDQQHIEEFNALCLIWEGNQGNEIDSLHTEVALKKLSERIKEFEELETEKNDRSGYRLNLLRVAAVLAGIAILSSVLYYMIPQKKDHQTSVPGRYEMAVSPPLNKSQIILKDGTKVWLNSGTKIKYPSDYDINTREIFLEGEAFFEVAKNRDKPFLVHASSIIIKALGTSFNVKCYANDNTIVTTLVEGKVQLDRNGDKKGYKSLFLNPNEKAVFVKSSDQFQVERYLLEKPEKRTVINTVMPIEELPMGIISEISWKDQKLIFENESLEDLAKRLERWYNVNISIEDEKLKNDRYTGKFVNNESLDQVLNILSRTTEIQYSINHDNVTIGSKK
jgi:transmembrane sensor